MEKILSLCDYKLNTNFDIVPLVLELQEIQYCVFGSLSSLNSTQGNVQIQRSTTEEWHGESQYALPDADHDSQ